MSMTPLNWTSSFAPAPEPVNQNTIEATINGEMIPYIPFEQDTDSSISLPQEVNQNRIEATVNGEMIPYIPFGQDTYGSTPVPQELNQNGIEATVNGDIIPYGQFNAENNNVSSNTQVVTPNGECERYLSNLFPEGQIEKNTQIDENHLQCFNGPDNTFTFSNGRVIKEINQSAISTTPVAESFQVKGIDSVKNNYFSFESKTADDSAPFIELGEYSFGAYSNFQSITGKNINGPPSLEPNKINKLPPSVSGRKAQIAFSDDSNPFDYKSYNNLDANSSEYKSSHQIPEQNKMVGRLNLPIPSLPQNFSSYGISQ